MSRRPPRNRRDPWRPYAFFLEEEPDLGGGRVSIAAIFLTNRECPWRCVMCDLWRNTLEGPSPAGAIPVQIDYALGKLAEGPSDGRRGLGAAVARQVKVYNSGSFFDIRAVPPGDYAAIAERLRGFERVIVECHPSLVNDRLLAFRDLLSGRLEVAMGLETAHREVLAGLNKGMTLDQFRRAAEYLADHAIDLRAFVLVQPPFLAEADSVEWAIRSAEFAFECGARVVSLIPVRGGNGALEALAAQGQFVPPRLSTLEAALEGSLALRRGQVLADLWDLRVFADCELCFESRCQRLRGMNLKQEVAERVVCCGCGE